MTFSAKSIANYFLDLAERSGASVDPMKLQKLIYYAHGWYAGYTGGPLIDESVEAWPYGPVIPSVYRAFQRFGSGEIKGRAMQGMLGGEPVPTPRGAEIEAFLNDIWQKYGQFDGWRLSDMTHARGGPWDVVRAAHPNERGVEIPFTVIERHFAKAAANSPTRT